jgi:hypothetical protein
VGGDRSGQSIVNPNAEIAEGFEAGVMPDDVGDKLSEQEVATSLHSSKMGG